MTKEEFKNLSSGKHSRPNKYKAQKVGGYASKKEANRAAILHALEKEGVIVNLREQVRYVLIPTQRNCENTIIERQCCYIADFVYHTSGGKLVVEDTKGMRTKEYILKRKLMLFRYGIQISEI